MGKAKAKGDGGKKRRRDRDEGQEKKGGDRKNTSLRLSEDMLKALKIRAIEEETSVQKIIEKLIEAYLAPAGKPQE